MMKNKQYIMVVVAVVVLILLPKLCYPQEGGGGGSLEDARTLMDNGEYKKAAQILKEILKKGGNTQGVVSEIYRRLGWCEGAMRNQKEATEYFKKLLLIKPDYTLPNLVSPVIKNPFRKALHYWENHQRVVILHNPPVPPKEGGEVIIEAQIEGEDLNLIKIVVAYVMTDKDKGFRKITPFVSLKNSYKWKVELGKGEKLSYYIVALDQYKNELFLSGTENRPFVIEVPKEEVVEKGPPIVYVSTQEKEEAIHPSTPWYKKWWFWTAIGTVVVGGGVLGIILGVKERETREVCSNNELCFDVGK